MASHCLDTSGESSGLLYSGLGNSSSYSNSSAGICFFISLSVMFCLQYGHYEIAAATATVPKPSALEEEVEQVITKEEEEEEKEEEEEEDVGRRKRPTAPGYNPYGDWGLGRGFRGVT